MPCFITLQIRTEGMKNSKASESSLCIWGDASRSEHTKPRWWKPDSPLPRSRKCGEGRAEMSKELWFVSAVTAQQTTRRNVLHSLVWGLFLLSN